MASRADASTAPVPVRLPAAPVPRVLRTVHAVVRRPARRRPRRPDPGSAVLVATDLLAVALALAVAGTPLRVLLLTAVATTVAVGIAGGHRRRLTPSLRDDVPVAAAAGLLGAGTVATTTSADAALVLGAALTAALLVGRAVAHPLVRAARRRGHGLRRTVVLGGGETGERVARAALEHPEHGLMPVGSIHDEPRPVDAPPPAVPRLGALGDLDLVLRTLDVDQVVVASDAPDDALVDLVLGRAEGLPHDVLWVPRFAELHRRSRDMDELWGIPLVRLRPHARQHWSWRAKRALDVVVSAGLLLVLAPVLLLAALAVRLELGPSVVYRQVRTGLDGSLFTIYKLRTLRLPEDATSAPVWSINSDERLGRVGRFLRATSIDELPQLVNVLRGEMSMVGPRPERPVFVDRFSHEVPHYRHRHRAPAGLTGWAQVNGLRGDTSIEDRARFDNYYIANWSLWLDLTILARTLGTVLLRRGS